MHGDQDEENKDNNRGTLFVHCNDEAISLELCSERQRGLAITRFTRIRRGHPYKFEATVFNDFVHLGSEHPGYTNVEYWQWQDQHGNNNTSGEDGDWTSHAAKPRDFSEGGSTLKWHDNGELVIKYHVNDTGYYCVETNSDEAFHTASMDWINSSGKLSYAEYPKVPFYGTMTVAYFINCLYMGIPFVACVERYPTCPESTIWLDLLNGG